LDTFEKALSLSRQTGNRRRKGTSLNNISQIYDARGDYDKALDFLKQSLAIRQEIGDLAGFCASTINMGHMHWQREEQQEALNAWVGAYLLAQKIGYAQALEALESIGTHLGGEGLEHWERLARQEEKESG
jgi:tetratricopeptide (TPR) repeat protein